MLRLLFGAALGSFGFLFPTLTWSGSSAGINLLIDGAASAVLMLARADNSLVAITNLDFTIYSLNSGNLIVLVYCLHSLPPP